MSYPAATVYSNNVVLFDLTQTMVQLPLGSCISTIFANKNFIIATHILNPSQAPVLLQKCEQLKKTKRGAWILLGIFGGKTNEIIKNHNLQAVLSALKDIPVIDIKKTTGFSQYLSIKLVNRYYLIELNKKLINSNEKVLLKVIAI